jgi:hypothetical protein
MKWLCKIGLHSWKLRGLTPLFMEHIYECQRDGCRMCKWTLMSGAVIVWEKLDESRNVHPGPDGALCN